MTNALGVCLLLALICCTNLSSARQLPKECSKGPEYWCQNLKLASSCGAVGHCIATIWEVQQLAVNSNEVSDKFVRLFLQLKDVKDLINEEYLASRISSACKEVPYPAVAQICKDNTAHLQTYLSHVLVSSTPAETLCQLIGMCNNMKVDNIIALNKKKGTEHGKHKETLLGSSRCTWGPSYWCSNFSTGHECKATRHCVDRVWSKMTFPVDTDDICKICTDMVQQARDQLQSNETQEELKEVFEGSCKLVPIKVVAKECIKLADDFVPELVETLASQMNPQAVCSVAGLCNNAKIDALLEGYNAQLRLRQDCTNCRRTVTIVRKRFDAATYDDFLIGLLRMCNKAGSLSDSCSMLVFKYYENIVEAVKKDLTPQSVCHLSGQCAYKYHSHGDYVFPKENLNELKATDDVPCEFCEQLITHLRDVLVANTTEMQFYKVLTGLCKQTGNFKDECLHLAEQYYTVIYKYLVSDLKPQELCVMMGICGKPADVPIAPLLPQELVVKAITPSSKLIGTDEANSYNSDKVGRVSVSNKQANVRVMSAEPEVPEVPEVPAVPEVPPPLPIERMFVSVPHSTVGCSFCQYFLHYLQVQLSDTKNELKIKDLVNEACDKLPSSFSSECEQFVTEYGPAVIALLVQEIDPASVCPALKLCAQTQEVRRVSINSEKSNCPLCLFAIEQLEAVLKKNRSETSIRDALRKLCGHLSKKLRTECVDFVDTYSDQLVEMLVANMNAQEICVYLKLCKDETSDPLSITHSDIDKYHDEPQLRGDRNNFRRPMLPERMLETGGDIETNEIPDNTVNGQPIHHDVTKKKGCHVCKIVIKELDHLIKDTSNEEEVRKELHQVCKKIPKLVRSECDKFIDRNADKLVEMIMKKLGPEKICKQLKLCATELSAAPVQPQSQKKICILCQLVLKEIDDQIKDKSNDDEIKQIVRNICQKVPKSVRSECNQFVDKYADLVISLLAQELDPTQVCEELKLCDATGITTFKEEILDCAVCETVVLAVKKVLSNDKVDRDIVHVVEKSCALLPAKYSVRCHTMMEIYGDSVIHLIEDYGTKGVCQKIGLCTGHDAAYVRMYRGHRDTKHQH